MKNSSIQNQFSRFAMDEGKSSALNELQNFQGAMEQIQEIGDDEERKAANFLLTRINEAIGLIVKSNIK